jgi:hypothetical protein
VEINRDNFIGIGPTGNDYNFDFCSFSSFQKTFNQSLDIYDPKFCEKNFCINYSLSNRTLDDQLYIFYVKSFQFIHQQCHVCVFGFNQSSFVENVKSGKCKSHGKSVVKSWNTMNLQSLQTFQPHFAILSKTMLIFIKMISQIDSLF